MLKLRIRCRNRNKIFRRIHDYLQSSTKLKGIIFLGLLFPMVFLVIRMTHTDRIKIFVLDTERDIEMNSPQGKWSILGWDYVTDINLNTLFKKTDISTAGFQMEADDGFWMALAPTKSIYEDSPSFVLDNFQYYYPVETSIGIRFYIGGSGKAEIVFRDAFDWEINTYIITRNLGHPFVAGEKKPEAKDYSLFCSHIIPLTFEGLVDRVEVKATFGRDDDSFVAVDRIFTTMGKHGGSRNLMLTMIPSNWCTNEYIYNWTPNKPEEESSRRKRYVMRYR